MAGVRFIIGRAGSGKTRHIFDQITRSLRDDPLTGPPIFWILPKQATFQAQRLLACGTDLGGFCRARIVAFDQLGRDVLNECGGIAVPQVTALGRQMVIGRLLRQLQPQLVFFASSAHRPGLVAELDATFAEIERCGKDVSELAGMLADLERDEADNAARAPLLAKIHDLRLLYTAYSSFLGQERLDPHRRIAQVVQQLAACSLFRNSSVFVDGFDEFTDHERQMLAGLARSARQLEVALTMDPTSPLLNDPHLLPNEMSLFHRTEQTYRKLLFTFTELNIAVDKPVVLRGTHRFSSSRLSTLEIAAFSPSPGTSGDGRGEGSVKSADRSTNRQNPHPNPLAAYRERGQGESLVPEIQLIECPDRRSEVDAAARYIRECLRGGMRLRDIAVLMRDLNEYHELIDASFREHAIPYFVDRRRTAAHHPLLQFARSAFQIAQHNWPHDAILAMLKGGLCGLELQQADELENYVLLHRVRGGAWASAEPWQYRRDLTAGSDELDVPPAERIELDRISAYRSTVVDRLRPFVDALRASRQFALRDIVRHLFALFDRFNVRQMLATWMTAATDAKQFELAGEHEQVWAELVDLFDQMVELLGDEKVSIADFLEILDAGLEQFDLALTPPTVDQVLVGQVDRTRTPDLKAVILLGLNEGQFPRVNREDSILSDSDRRLLRQRRIDIDPDTQRQLLDERYLGYIAFTRSSQCLCVTRSISDDAARPAGPSLFWRRLVELMPDAPVDQVPRDVGADPSRIGTPRQLITALMRWVRQPERNGADSTHQPTWSALYQWLATHDCRDDPVDVMRGRAWRALAYENAASLAPEIGRKLFASPLHGSVSRIETFATCPFKHFARYGLKLRPREEQDVTSLDLGNVYHQILEKIVREMLQRRSDWAELEPGVAEQMVRSFAEEVGRSLRGELMLSNARNRYLLQHIEKTLHHVIAAQRAIRARGQFRPTYAELTFGGDAAAGGLPPYRVRTPGGGELLLHGKIDRVDTLEQESDFAVIDYKLTGDSLALDRVYHGISLQLLTYMLVLQSTDGEKFHGRKLTPAAAFYVRLLRKLDDVKHPDDATPPDDPTFHLKVKPRGIFDARCLGALDSELTAGSSDVVMAYIKKDGQLGRRDSTDAAEKAEFERLLTHVRERIGQLGDQILSGEIGIGPYRINRATPCPHCEYRPLCRFDASINSYNTLRSMSREDVFVQLGQQNRDGGGRHVNG